MAITQNDIEAMFTYHSPKGDQPQRYQAIRESAKELAMVIIVSTPPSADQTAAIRLLRECVMTANASIALEA
jgi:glucose-6-phosphate 1-dehydrogenase